MVPECDLQRGPSESEVMPLVSYQVNAEAILRWE